jgi:riboflavin kinase/FMN adenylyltransferase
VLTVQNTEHFRLEKPTIVTIGTFDGVHLGHQKILKRLAELKKTIGINTVVLTFEPHPRKILFPNQKDLKLLTLIDEKLELLKKYGVDITVVYPFTKSFAESSPKHYVEEILIKQLKVQHLVIGYDHKFAKDRQGDIQLLKQYSKVLDFKVEEIPALDIDSIAVSSSKIRRAIEEGNIELAREYLGHSFFLNAKVILGKQLGRKLGFATANLLLLEEEKMVPKIGVYFVEVLIASQLFYGMMNIGLNPTTDLDQKVKLEVHLFDFEKDIYNKTVKVSFLRRLRDEKKFTNLDELKAALQLDKKNCLKLMT